MALFPKFDFEGIIDTAHEKLEDLEDRLVSIEKTLKAILKELEKSNKKK